MPRAFTLVELMVVITIIVVLLALMTPGLDKAISAAQLARCLANHHAMARALHFYLGDHRQAYPVMDVWWDLVGDSGDDRAFSEVTTRGLNVYLGYTSDGSRVPVAQCPSDNGDVLVPLTNVYKVAGTSYLPCYSPAKVHQDTGYAGVKFVFGHTGGVLNPYGAFSPLYINTLPSARRTSLNPQHTKVILMDWPWHANRRTDSEQTRWHKPESLERLISTQFADGHAELFNWDKEYIDPTHNGVESREYNTSWKWW